MALKQKTRWVDEEGFEFIFRPTEDSIKIKKTKAGYEAFYITPDECPERPDSWGDNNLFLVHYHRDCWIVNDDVIKEDDVKNWYRQEFDNYDGGVFPCAEKYWIYAVSAYIHSGVRLSLNKTFFYDAQGWDTSHVGAVLVAKEEWPDEEKAKEAAEGMVEEWNQYLSGDVWCIVREKYDKKKNQLDYDVIGGFYGEKYALEALMDGSYFE